MLQKRLNLEGRAWPVVRFLAWGGDDAGRPDKRISDDLRGSERSTRASPLHFLDADSIAGGKRGQGHDEVDNRGLQVGVGVDFLARKFAGGILVSHDIGHSGIPRLIRVRLAPRARARGFGDRRIGAAVPPQQQPPRAPSAALTPSASASSSLPFYAG